MLNGWPCWNDSTLLLTRNVRVQLLCAGGRDRSWRWNCWGRLWDIGMLMYKGKPCHWNHAICLQNNRNKRQPNDLGDRWCFKVLLWAGPFIVYRFFPRNSDCYKMKNQLFYAWKTNGNNYCKMMDHLCLEVKHVNGELPQNVSTRQVIINMHMPKKLP